MILISNVFIQPYRRSAAFASMRRFACAKAKRILCVAAFLASEMNREPTDLVNFFLRRLADGAPEHHAAERSCPRSIAECRKPEMLEDGDSEIGASASVGRDQPRQAGAAQLDVAEAAEIPILGPPSLTRVRRSGKARRPVRWDDVDEQAEDGGGDERCAQYTGAPLFDPAEDQRVPSCDQPSRAAFESDSVVSNEAGEGAGAMGARDQRQSQTALARSRGAANENASLADRDGAGVNLEFRGERRRPDAGLSVKCDSELCGFSF